MVSVSCKNIETQTGGHGQVLLPLQKCSHHDSKMNGRVIKPVSGPSLVFAGVIASREEKYQPNSRKKSCLIYRNY